MTISRSWQVRLGGRYAISWRSFLFTSSLALAYVAQIQSFGNQKSSSVITWLGIFTFALFIVGGINYWLHRTIFSNRARKPIPLLPAIALHAIQGFIFALAIIIGGNLLELKQTLAPLLQIALTTVIATWWGSALAIFLDHREENQQKRRSLIEQAVALESLRIRQVESAKALQRALKEEVRSELIDAESELQRNIKAQDWAGSSALLMDTASKVVRSKSHNLDNLTPISYPKIRWWQLPYNIIKYQQINLWLIITIAIIGAYPQRVAIFGTSRALQMTAISNFIVLVLCLVGNYLMKRFEKFHAQIFIGTSLLLQVTLPIEVYFREKYLPGNSPVTWQVMQVILGLMLILLTSGFGGRSNISARMNANLQEVLNDRHIESIATSRQFAIQAREVSKILHGSVQTKLVACSLAIENAANFGDDAALSAAITQALDILNSPLQEQNVGASIEDEVNRKVSLWNEICKIRVIIKNSQLPHSEDRIIQIGQVVEEGISNAIRHGRAKNINISIDIKTDHTLEIHIVDDGTGSKGGAPSLGSALLGQVTQGNWSLTDTENGSDLHMVIPG